MAKKKASSVLISIDGVELARSYIKLQNAARGLAPIARGLAYWADGRGGGRFTPMVSAAAVSFIQDTIDGKHPELTNSFQSLDDRYAKWKDNLYGSTSFWKRSGKVRDSFMVDVQKSGRRSMGVITIDPSATTPVLSYSPNKNYGEISAATVFKWLEFGTKKMAPRPLVGAAIRKFVSIHFPKMVNSVDRALSKWVKQVKGKAMGPKQGVGDISNVVGQASIAPTTEALASASPEQDFSDDVIKDAFVSGAVSSGPSVYESELAQMDRELLKDLKAQGLDPAEIQRIMDGMKGV
jgi:hypothetical protein